MNVEHIAATIIAVPADWSFGAVLGSAFPIAHERRSEFEECLKRLDPLSQGQCDGDRKPAD